MIFKSLTVEYDQLLSEEVRIVKASKCRIRKEQMKIWRFQFFYDILSTVVESSKH